MGYGQVFALDSSAVPRMGKKVDSRCCAGHTRRLGAWKEQSDPPDALPSEERGALLHALTRTRKSARAGRAQGMLSCRVRRVTAPR